MLLSPQWLGMSRMLVREGADRKITKGRNSELWCRIFRLCTDIEIKNMGDSSPKINILQKWSNQNHEMFKLQALDRHTDIEIKNMNNSSPKINILRKWSNQKP